MYDVVEFLKFLANDGFVEINNLDHVLSYKDAIGQENMYFCAWLREKPTKRCWDDDIGKKNYFVVDFDIRAEHYKRTKEILSQEWLVEEANKIVNKLSENGLQDFSAMVYSGNGMHLYYCWTPRVFDKTVYSNGVESIFDQIDILVKDLWHKTDHACKNLARLIKLPWTLNPRRKKTKDMERDLWPIEATLEYFDPKISLHFEMIEEFAEVYSKEKEEEKQAQKQIKEIVKKEYKKTDDIRKQINEIPARQIAEDIWGVVMCDKGLDNVALREEKKNMWAYRYKPYNIIVNTGSSMIKTNKSCFTPYELVYYEHTNQDKKATLEYFKDKYNIELNSWTIIQKKDYDVLGFTYGDSCFDAFDCFMSGELVTVVAESNSWKTTFAMDIIKENSTKYNRKCLYINLEFPIETVRKQRWLFINKKKKRNLTDLDPLTDEEQHDMDEYVKSNLSKFDYYNNPNGIELSKLVDLIVEYNKQWYVMFVIDTFSRITGNLNSQIAHSNQNSCMETLQELCQSLWVGIINLHHTNKKKEFEGSQKIHDLSNVFVLISKEEDMDWNKITKYELSKDKFVTKIEVNTYRVNNRPSLTPPEKPF